MKIKSNFIECLNKYIFVQEMELKNKDVQDQQLLFQIFLCFLLLVTKLGQDCICLLVSFMVVQIFVFQRVSRQEVVLVSNIFHPSDMI